VVLKIQALIQRLPPRLTMDLKIQALFRRQAANEAASGPKNSGFNSETATDGPKNSCFNSEASAKCCQWSQ